jgi:hypothetical protein
MPFRMMLCLSMIASALLAAAQAAPIMGNMHMRYGFRRSLRWPIEPFTCRLQTLSDVEYEALFAHAIAESPPVRARHLLGFDTQ